MDGWPTTLRPVRNRGAELETHKQEEQARYDEKAGQAFSPGGSGPLPPEGAVGYPLYLRAPYRAYEEVIREVASGSRQLLDVCAGTGNFSLVGARVGATVTALDLSARSLVIARERARRTGLRLETVVSDAEHLPFATGSFDVVTCAGSLSYVDLNTFLAELKRVLGPGGWFVCVDSLNHNPVYSANRRIQCWRGHRSALTCRRMPTMGTVAAIQEMFENGGVRFFGVASFLGPVLQPILGEQLTADLLDNIDTVAGPLRRYAFKFLIWGQIKT